MPRGVPQSTCAHPRDAKRRYVHPASGRVEWRCRICHNQRCAAARALRKNPSYYQHYDVRIYVDIARTPWTIPPSSEENTRDQSRSIVSAQQLSKSRGRR